MTLLVMALFGLAYALLPLLSFLRSGQNAREIDRLTRRIDWLERELSGRTVAPPQAAPPAQPAQPAPSIPQSYLEQERRAPVLSVDESRVSEDARNLALEERIGGRWLQHAGLVILLLGVAFFLRYAFDHDWLSPRIRVALGIFAGIAMAAVGLRVARAYRHYGLLLTGGGIAAMYLSVYAGLNLYALYGAQAAFAMLVAVTVASAVLADRIDAEAIALVAVIGGFAAPFLVGGGQDRQITLFTYVALLVAATMCLAHRRRWPWLNVASLGLTAITVLAWAARYYTDAAYLRTELFLTLYCAMFVDMLRRSWSARDERAMFAASLFLAPISYHVWSVFALAPHGLAFLVYLILFTVVTVILSISSTSTLVRVAAWLAMALPLGGWIDAHHWRDWVMTTVAAVTGIYGIHLAAQIRTLVEQDGEFDEREVFLVHANGVGVYVALYQVLVDRLPISALAGLAVLLAALNAGIWWSFRTRAPARALHWLAVAFTLVAAGVWLQFGGPWVVAIWATESAVVFWSALETERHWLRVAGWALLVMAIVRWAQPDIQETTTAFIVVDNARALTGLYIVAMAYLMAWLTARHRPAMGSTEPHERAALLIAASVVTLIVLSTEIVSFWTLRTADVNAYVAREMMLSACWVAYAAIVITIGMRRQYAPIRYFAIVLFGVALLKVFFVDLETLAGIYRIVGFLVVGLILLVVSFMYQRKMTTDPRAAR